MTLLGSRREAEEALDRRLTEALDVLADLLAIAEGPGGLEDPPVGLWADVRDRSRRLLSGRTL